MNRYFKPNLTEIDTTKPYYYGDVIHAPDIFRIYSEAELKSIGILTCKDAPEKTVGETIEIVDGEIVITPYVTPNSVLIYSRDFPTWQVLATMEVIKYGDGTVMDFVTDIFSKDNSKNGILSKSFMSSPAMGRVNRFTQYLEDAGLPKEVLDTVFETTLVEFGGQ